MGAIVVILCVLLAAAAGAAAWFYIAHKLNVRRTAKLVTDALKGSRQ